MSQTLIENGVFLSMTPDAEIIHGELLIQDDTIVYIGEAYPGDRHKINEIIDGSGKVYLPGFVNTHGHAAMSLLRGYADDLSLQVWLFDKMFPMEAQFTASDVRAGTELALIEMIKSGTTTFVDMYDHMDQVAEAVEASGMRAVLTRGVIGLAPEPQATAKLQEAEAFIRRWQGQADGRITTMMAPHSAYTCPPEYIKKIVGISERLDVPIHTHMSETLSEVEKNVSDYGKRPPEHLAALGVFDRPCLVAHAVHLNDAEIELLVLKNVHVSHNPGSNLKLASGVARLPEMLEAGIQVSLGTDSAASNNNLDLLHEIRLAALIHKGVTQNPLAISARTALQLGTSEGSKALWLENVGTLQIGQKADITAIGIEQAHYTPEANWISHIVYAGYGRDVTDVCVNGKWLLREGKCTTIDEEKVRYQATRAFTRLRKV